jgi:glycosyltransferase involved in cell wall biosynthesis
MKLGCVIHRFGPGIAGGSEGHCRAIAEQLAAARHDVTVLTTCAEDHVTWHNRYPAGESLLGPVRVHRFPVRRPRSLHRFAEISEVVSSGRASEAEQDQWFRENGPDAPSLVEFPGAHRHEYDWILFWAYRYAPTFFGLPTVRDRAILVPTAEEDPVIRLDVLGRFFTLPAGFLFLTPEEQALVERRADGPIAPSCVIGSGLEPRPSSSESPGAPAGVPEPFVLYLGRIDPNKGCETLLRHFITWSEQNGNRVPLVMAGPANMPLPDHGMVRPLGYVTDRQREALLSRAALLVVPSPFESLSMVLLEAWNHGLPALVNGRCSVLRGQALRANGALYYRNYAEFAQGLDYLLQHPDVSRSLGRQGRAYVDREYRWPRVIGAIETFLESLPRQMKASTASGTGGRADLQVRSGRA